MALTYFPFDAGIGANVTEDQWRKMARFWRDTGVLAGEDNQFAVSESTPNAMSVAVATGKAWIRGHYLESTAIETVALAAAHATLDRIDRIVLRVDFGANTIVVDKLTGTPAASPSAPALTQSISVWEISLAQVRVLAAAVAITNARITDERTISLGGGAATVATKVSDLGPGVNGKLGLIRLMPTTHNAGGATALPAGTLTVGNTDGFATAGTLETPNGDIAYTNKTATTFTGCTGGVGTLAANAVIRQKTATSGVVDYQDVQVVYDAVLGKWVSHHESIPHGNSTNAGFGDSTGWTETPNGGHPAVARWRWYDAAGLKPQVKITTQPSFSGTHTNYQIRVHFRGNDWGFTGTAQTATDMGADTASASRATSFTDTQQGTIETPWANLPGGYTVKDFLRITIDHISSATAGGAVSHFGLRGTLRWAG